MIPSLVGTTTTALSLLSLILHVHGMNLGGVMLTYSGWRKWNKAYLECCILLREIFIVLFQPGSRDAKAARGLRRSEVPL